MLFIINCVFFWSTRVSCFWYVFIEWISQSISWWVDNPPAVPEWAPPRLGGYCVLWSDCVFSICEHLVNKTCQNVRHTIRCPCIFHRQYICFLWLLFKHQRLELEEQVMQTKERQCHPRSVMLYVIPDLTFEEKSMSQPTKI